MPDNQPYKEKELLLQIAEGDEKAFNTLLAAHWHTIFSHALAYLKSVQQAEEMTQDIFLKLWNSRKKLKDVVSLKDYLFIIARNSILNETRKKIRSIYSPLDVRMDMEPSPVHQLELKETYQQLLDAIEQLPEKRRLVFKLSRLEGLSNEQIALRLGIHKDTIYQYLTKATSFLKLYISENVPPAILLLMLLN